MSVIFEEIRQSKLNEQLIALNKELEQFIQIIMNNEGDVDYQKQYPNIFNLYETHNGLCDIVCNYFTLAKPANLSELKNIDGITAPFYDNELNFKYKKLDSLAKTHLLSLVSTIELLLFAFLKIVPNNIFSFTEQRKLHNSKTGINKELLSVKLDTLNEGQFVKFSTFETTSWGFPSLGHSRLLTKIEDKFIFFNPNNRNPQCLFLDKNELMERLSNISKGHERVAFIDNDEFMKRVKGELLDELVAAPASRG